MRLVRVKLELFRGFREPASIDIDDISVFLGKNRAGKSSVLDVLDIFFNRSAPDRDDACVSAQDKAVVIACLFSDLPDEIVIDATNRTTLEGEYLVNKDGGPEIAKIYDCSLGKPRLSAASWCQPPGAH